MGTNFFLATPFGTEGEHIGKRSAAGLYCWDCDISLARDGDFRDPDYKPYLSECPGCEEEVKTTEPLEASAAGRELGFNREPYAGRKTGIASASSFRWALTPKRLKALSKRTTILDEYGRPMTLLEFRRLLVECPIQHYDSIGQEFS